MGKLFAIFLLSSVAFGVNPAVERGNLAYAPGAVVSQKNENMQSEIIRLKSELKKQIDLVKQLQNTCIILKKENKLMRDALKDANLPLPNIFEKFEQEQKILEQQKQIAISKEAAIQSIECFSSGLHVGQLTKLCEFEVEKHDRHGSWTDKYHHFIKIIQIVDKNNIIAEVQTTTGGVVATIWLQGINTQNMVDGQVISDKIFKVIGTKTYSTTDGATNTVFVLEPYTLPN